MATIGVVHVSQTAEEKLGALVKASDALESLAEILKTPDLMKMVKEIGSTASAAYDISQEKKVALEAANKTISDAATAKKELEEMAARTEQAKSDALAEIKKKNDESDESINARIDAVKLREDKVDGIEKDAAQKVSDANQKVIDNNTEHATRMGELEIRERTVNDAAEAAENQRKENEAKKKSLTEWEASLTKMHNKLSGVLSELKP